MPQPSDHRSIADRSWDIRQSLLDLLDKARTTEAPIQPQEVEDVLDRFKLWSGNLGALHQAHKRISLESRLADSPAVQGQICEQLDDMQEAIQDLLTLGSETCVDLGSNIKDEQHDPGSVDLPADDFVPVTEYTSSKEKAISILSMVSECLKALFRIGILVRKATPRDRFDRALQQSEFEFTPQFDINYVQERYPKLASQYSRWLASRLGGANAKRRQFINYVRDHKAKLEVEGIDPTAAAMTMVQSSKATTFAVPENLSASEFLNLPLEVEDDSVSLVSASTAFNNDTSLRLPSLADLGPDGEYFECPICFTLQSFHLEKSWKIHAYRDLKAYVCTSTGEECEHKMFGDRDSWFNHELKHHHSLYMCKFCGIHCTATKMLQQHILGEHGTHSDEEVLSLIEHGKLVPSQLKAQDCPFCDEWASILSHRRHQTEGRTSSSIQQTDILVSLTHFKRHVATHQEQLAIFAVPRTVDDDEEHSHGAVEANSEAVSSKDDNSQIADKEDHPMEDSTPSQRCVYLTGLPRAVSEADIENHFRLGGFRAITEVTLMGDFAMIQFEDPGDVRLAVASMHESTLIGARINVTPALLSLDQETHIVEEPHADNFNPVRAISEINAAESHFRIGLLPMCEEFIANPPSDPQKRQDQSTHLVTMIRQQVWSTVNFIDARNHEEVMVRKAEVLGPVDDMLERIRAVPSVDREHAEIKVRDGDQGEVSQLTTNRGQAKLWKLLDNEWQDQGTGFCTAKFVETADERKEAYLILNSEEDPGRLILEERVHKGDNFQQQMTTLIVWTERQTRIDMALSFQHAADADTIWKIINAVQRGVKGELRVPEAHFTEEVSKVNSIDDISIHPSSFRQDIIDVARDRPHDSPEDDQTAEEDAKQQGQQASEMIRSRTIAQEESKAYGAQSFKPNSLGIWSEDGNSQSIGEEAHLKVESPDYGTSPQRVQMSGLPHDVRMDDIEDTPAPEPLSAVRQHDKRTKRPAPGIISPTNPGISSAVTKRKTAPKKLSRGDKRKKVDHGAGQESTKGEVEGEVDDDGNVIDPNEQRYCVCNRVSFGAMVLCENIDCSYEWFHLECLGLESEKNLPKLWYCPECRVSLGMDGERREGGKRTSKR